MPKIPIPVGSIQSNGHFDRHERQQQAALPLQAPAGDTASAHTADGRGSELGLLVYQLAKPRGRVLGVQCTLADGCGARLVRRRERGEQFVLGKEPG